MGRYVRSSRNLYIGTLSFPHSSLKPPWNSLQTFCPGGPRGILLFWCCTSKIIIKVNVRWNSCVFKSRLFSRQISRQISRKIWLQVIFSNSGKHLVFIIGVGKRQSEEQKHFTDLRHGSSSNDRRQDGVWSDRFYGDILLNYLLTILCTWNTINGRCTNATLHYLLIEFIITVRWSRNCASDTTLLYRNI